MTSPPWERVREIFEGALDVEPGERVAFLDEACAGDAATRRTDARG